MKQIQEVTYSFGILLLFPLNPQVKYSEENLNHNNIHIVNISKKL